MACRIRRDSARWQKQTPKLLEGGKTFFFLLSPSFLSCIGIGGAESGLATSKVASRLVVLVDGGRLVTVSHMAQLLPTSSWVSSYLVVVRSASLLLNSMYYPRRPLVKKHDRTFRLVKPALDWEV